ncbi:hypothetical protein NCER_100566 [Vairimorpha ceranae BRL01]|uniref:Uncharacterized protein n=2 Tax=Vairimorpha ceranae TaxID=40302 RepID=C4V7X1_VAIC1|nr:hypothetical protein NCER_100566 [Vairimorpha ceranae BRL01]
MKITGVMVFVGTLLAKFCERENVDDCSGKSKRFRHTKEYNHCEIPRNRGRHFGMREYEHPRRDPCITIGPCGRNDGFLLPFTFDCITGFFNRENLRRAFFNLVQHRLRYLEKHLNFSHNFQSSLFVNFDEIAVDLREIFRKFIYLVHFNDYAHYKKCFYENKYIECFYIMYNNVSCTRYVFDYMNILASLPSNCKIDSSHFYRCKEKCLVDTKLNICSFSGIPSADFLIDPVSILELNLYERTQLLKFFFTRYYFECSYGEIEERLIRFLDLYRDVYLNGSIWDHRVTAFVMYKIFSELRFKRFNDGLIDRMYEFLRLYSNGTLIRIAKFFCILTFGCFEK